MPIISEFYGITISMYVNDHNPPHFHANYGDDEALVLFSGKLEKGFLPPKALKLIRDWVKLHKPKLIKNWKRIIKDQAPKKIPALR